MSIRVRCTTNLDSHFRHDWPTELSILPQKGDYIQSAQGGVLKVVRITHLGLPDGPHLPAVEIELHN